MNITALLSWYDEPVELLEKCVRSLRGFCDRLIAVDGAYEFTPTHEQRSPIEQGDIIWDAAVKVGLEVEVFEAWCVWKGQIAKRQYLFDMAIDADWVLIHDADHQLRGDPQRFRGFLAGLPDDVVAVDVPYKTPRVHGKTLTPWHDWLTTTQFFTPLIFRRLPELRVERHHWWYSGLLNGQKTALWGWDKSGGDLEGADTLPHGKHVQTKTLRVTHRCFDRPEETLERQRRLYRKRDDIVTAHGVEP